MDKYTPTIWKDRMGTGLNKYKDQNDNILILTNIPDEVIVEVPVDASKLNNIENGIVEAFNRFSKSEQITLLSSNWILNEETGLYEYNYTTTQYEITDNTDLDIRLDDADLDYIEENGFTIRGKTFDGYATLNSKDKKIEQDLHCTIIYSDSVDITEQEEE